MCNIPSKSLWDQRHWINTKHKISTVNKWTMLHKSLFSTPKTHRMCWSFGRFKKSTTVLNSENQEQNLGCPWVLSALLIPQPFLTSFRKTALLQKQSVCHNIFLRASINVLKILWCIHCYTFLFPKGRRGWHCWVLAMNSTWNRVIQSDSELMAFSEVELAPAPPWWAGFIWDID